MTERSQQESPPRHNKLHYKACGILEGADIEYEVYTAKEKIVNNKRTPERRMIDFYIIEEDCTRTEYSLELEEEDTCFYYIHKSSSKEDDEDVSLWYVSKSDLLRDLERIVEYPSYHD